MTGMAAENKAYESLKLCNQVCFPLYACSKELIRQYGPHLKELGLTYTQYLVMMVLWEKQTVTSRELAECLHLDYGTLTPVLKKLESMGYINRKRDEKDERNLILTLTEAGEALKERAALIPPQMSACIRMDPQDAIQLYTLLHRLLDTMCEED